MKGKKRLVFFVIFFLLTVLAAVAFFVWKGTGSEDPKKVQQRDKQDSDVAYTELYSFTIAQKERYDFVVIINPAHGGLELGETIENVQEKNVVHQIAEQVRKENKDADIGIFLTRMTDTNPSEEQRRLLAESMEADLWIDLHVIKQAEPEAYGTAVYYPAQYYNPKLTNENFADILERETVTSIEGIARGTFQEQENQFKYEILHNFTIPAAAVEIGNMENAEEKNIMMQDEFYVKVAQGLLKGIYQVKQQLTE